MKGRETVPKSERGQHRQVHPNDLKRKWVEFREECVPKETSEAELALIEAAFYTGASHVILRWLDAGALSIAALFELFAAGDNLDAEADEYWSQYGIVPESRDKVLDEETRSKILSLSVVMRRLLARKAYP